MKERENPAEFRPFLQSPAGAMSVLHLTLAGL